MVRVCENCGAHLTDEYVKVMYPDDDTIPICPNCPGMNKESFSRQLVDMME